MRINLNVTEGPHQGRTFVFDRHDMFIVGRSTRAHFRLAAKDKSLSRMHFMVEINPPQCRLVDMGSTNGTLVNGRKTDWADLKDADKIQAGDTVMVVSLESNSETALSARDQTSQTKLAESRTGVALPGKRAAAKSHSPQQPRPKVSLRPQGESSAPAPRSCLACGCPATAKTILLCQPCERRLRAEPQPIIGYVLVRQLGQGGMGVVHLAYCEADGTVAALKTIIPAVAGTRSQVERFLREAEILRQLSHPHIVGFRDMGESNGQLYFAMDYVAGETASQLLKKDGPLSVSRAVGLVCQLLKGLEYAHAQGFVHRDIKPGNLLVSSARGAELAKLADFGLARVYQASQLSGLTLTGDIGGTVGFIAPEQITHYREAKPPADLYAAGATLYNLLTGHFLFDFKASKKHRLMVVLEDEPVPIASRREDLPEDLASVIHRSLAKEPKERFDDAGEMLEALRAFR